MIGLVKKRTLCSAEQSLNVLLSEFTWLKLSHVGYCWCCSPSMQITVLQDLCSLISYLWWLIVILLTTDDNYSVDPAPLCYKACGHTNSNICEIKLEMCYSSVYRNAMSLHAIIRVEIDLTSFAQGLCRQGTWLVSLTNNVVNTGYFHYWNTLRQRLEYFNSTSRITVLVLPYYANRNMCLHPVLRTVEVGNYLEGQPETHPCMQLTCLTPNVRFTNEPLSKWMTVPKITCRLHLSFNHLHRHWLLWINIAACIHVASVCIGNPLFHLFLWRWTAWLSCREMKQLLAVVLINRSCNDVKLQQFGQRWNLGSSSVINVLWASVNMTWLA